MKLTIIYLKQHAVEVEAPPNFDAMDPSERLMWADDQLASVPATCCGIESPDGTIIVDTNEYSAYWGEREILEDYDK